MNEKTGISVNVIKELTIKSKIEGAAETSAKLKRVQAAYERSAGAFEVCFKAQQSLAEAVAKVEMAFAAALARQEGNYIDIDCRTDPPRITGRVDWSKRK